MKIPCVELGPVESLDKEFFVEECDMEHTSSAKDDGANREHGTAGMSLRDYFAAHAPEQKWAGYAPTMPPRPTPPMAEPVGNDGEAPTDDEQRLCDDWRRDPIFDLHTSLPKFSYWAKSWCKYWDAVTAWDNKLDQERDRQWPYWYADAMLKERSRG